MLSDADRLVDIVSENEPLNVSDADSDRVVVPECDAVPEGDALLEALQLQLTLALRLLEMLVVNEKLREKVFEVDSVNECVNVRCNDFVRVSVAVYEREHVAEMETVEEMLRV